MCPTFSGRSPLINLVMTKCPSYDKLCVPPHRRIRLGTLSEYWPPRRLMCQVQLEPDIVGVDVTPAELFVLVGDDISLAAPLLLCRQ